MCYLMTHQPFISIQSVSSSGFQRPKTHVENHGSNPVPSRHLGIFITSHVAVFILVVNWVIVWQELSTNGVQSHLYILSALHPEPSDLKYDFVNVD